MGRAAEEAFERHCQFLDSYFVPGAKVWRAESRRRGEWEVLEGEVVDVERVRFSSLTQSFSPHPDGDSLRWRARFPRTAKWGGSHDWFTQTCEHEFFASRAGALRRLAWEVKQQAERAELEAAEHRVTLARIEQAISAELEVNR